MEVLFSGGILFLGDIFTVGIFLDLFFFLTNYWQVDVKS